METQLEQRSGDGKGRESTACTLGVVAGAGCDNC
jgi:hypothetical protein